MKSSAVAMSGMPSGHKYVSIAERAHTLSGLGATNDDNVLTPLFLCFFQMGWWGDMGGPKQKGIIQYSVSPFYQNTMHNAFRSYAFFGYKRLAAQLPYFAIPVGIGE